MPPKVLNISLEGDEPEDEDEEIDLDTVKKAVLAKQQPVAPTVSNILLQNTEEDEDEDEEITPAEIAALVGGSLAPVALTIERSAEGSADFVDAEQSIAADPWDLKAWSTYLSETEKDKGGPVTVVDGYERYLQQFPRAALVWERYAGYYSSKGEFNAAEEVFKRCLIKCRSIPLWEAYLLTVKLRTVDRVSKYSDAFEEEKRQYSSAFEKAIDNVGMSALSHKIWRKYIEFVNDWREDSEVEIANKSRVLRDIYRRAIVIPMEGLDRFWAEFELLERKKGEQLAEQVLPEFLEKHRFAKALFEKRRHFIRKIDFDRLSAPAGNELDELHQVEAWDGLTKYELTNPQGLTPELHKAYMEMHFAQALMPLRHHPEIWMTFADFLLSRSSVQAARDILRDSITTVPDALVLRLMLAQLEERGSLEAARDVMKQAFDEIPGMMSFSVWQRMCHQVDGVPGGRAAFSSTIGLRHGQSHKNMYGLYMAHALLELDINNEPEVALRVLEQAGKLYPDAGKDINYVRLWFKVLVRLRNMSQLRWLVSMVLETNKKDIDPIFSSTKDGATENTVVDLFFFSIEQKIELFEDYLAVEINQGMISVSLHNELISRRLELKEKLTHELALKPKQAVSSKTAGRLDDVPSSLAACGGIFDSSIKLYERFGGIVPRSEVPKSDNLLMQRCFLSDLIADVSRTVTSVESIKRTVRDSTEIESLASQLSIPMNIKELLYKLPQVSGLAVSTETFVERLRKVILPPRPIEVAAPTVQNSLTPDNNDMDVVVEDIFRARQRQKLFH